MPTVYVTSVKTPESELIGADRHAGVDDDAIDVFALRKLVDSLNKHRVPGTARVQVNRGQQGGVVLRVEYKQAFGCPAGEEDLALHRLEQTQRADEERRQDEETKNGLG